MRILYIILFLLIVSEISSAQKSEYHFSLGTYENKPILMLFSTKTFPCSNYGIILRQGWSRDTLTVNILGIDTWMNCNNIIDVAKEYAQIIGIRSKEFHLRFKWDEKEDLFLVEFDGESFSVSAEKDDFITYITQ